MKKISKFAAILTALALVLALAACSHPNSGDDSSGSSSNSGGTQTATTLDGTYSGTFNLGSISITVVFNSNGTVSATGNSITSDGTYSIDGTHLSGSSGNSNKNRLTYSGTKQTDTTWSIIATANDHDYPFTITKQ